MITEIHKTRKEREMFLRSILQKDVGVVPVGGDDFVLTVENEDESAVLLTLTVKSVDRFEI